VGRDLHSDDYRSILIGNLTVQGARLSGNIRGNENKRKKRQQY
jgi:hypothetical protein